MHHNVVLRASALDAEGSGVTASWSCSPRRVGKDAGKHRTGRAAQAMRGDDVQRVVEAGSGAVDQREVTGTAPSVLIAVAAIGPTNPAAGGTTTKPTTMAVAAPTP